jgi:hypothetical protein
MAGSLVKHHARNNAPTNRKPGPYVICRPKSSKILPNKSKIALRDTRNVSCSLPDKAFCTAPADWAVSAAALA